MKDFGEVFSLLEKIDPQYKNHMSAKREVNEAVDDSFSFKQLNEFYEYNDYDAAFDYCQKHLGFCIGSGSSRAVFQVDDGRCLKIALNDKGVQQNKVETETNKNDCLLFPLIFGKSDKSFWVLTEYVLPAKEEDFPQCLNMSWGDFCGFIYNLDYQKYSKFKDERVVSQIEADKSGTLQSLYNYVIKYRIPCGDMVRMCNWGITVRHGKETLVLLDSGWNKETMRMYGGYASTSRSHYSDKISYHSSDFD